MIKFLYKNDLKMFDEFNERNSNILTEVKTLQDIKRNKVIMNCFNNVFSKDEEYNIEKVFEDFYNHSNIPTNLLCYKYGLNINSNFKDSLIDKFKLNLIIEKVNVIHSILGFNKINLFLDEINIKFVVIGIATRIKIPYNGNYQVDDVYDYLIGVYLSDELQLEIINGYI